MDTHTNLLNATIEETQKIPANVLVVTIRKLEVQIHLQCVLRGCMGTVAKLFLLWREGKGEMLTDCMGRAGNRRKRKVLLVIGV